MGDGVRRCSKCERTEPEVEFYEKSSNFRMECAPLRRHDAHFTGLHVAQEARKDMRAGDQEYATSDGATRFQTGVIVDTDQRAKADAGTSATRPVPLSSGAASSPSIDPRVVPQMTLLELRTLAFELPMPPSVNEAWHHVCVRGSTRHTDRVHVALTNEHRHFRSTVIGIVKGAMLKSEQRAKPLAGRIEMRLALFYANRRRTDIDNRIKPLQDALTHAHAYVDDSQIDRLVVERILITGAERCEVTLVEIAA